MRRLRRPLAPGIVGVLLVAACTTSTDTVTPTTEAVAPSSSATATADPGFVPEPVPGETYYALYPQTVELDGALDDWQGVPTVVIPPTADVVVGATSVEFGAVADDEFLYLMADVTDGSIVAGEHGTDYWNEDSVEFYLNATGDLDLTSYGDGVAQITVPALNAESTGEELVIGGVRGDTSAATGTVVRTDGGYAIELAVPLQNRVWNIRREHGASIGFQVHLNSASETDRDVKVIWSSADTSDNSYQNPSLFGRMTFFERGRSDVTVEATPTTAPAMAAPPEDAAYRQSDLPTEQRIDDLLDRMTLAEKIGQMTLVEKDSITIEDIGPLGIGAILSGGGGSPEPNTPAAWQEMVLGFQDQARNSRLGVPLLYGIDAVHGHNNVAGAVIFPHNIGLGAANDPDLVERIGRATGMAMLATAITWNYAPAVSVPQDIRWGRTYEGFSEDTATVSELATAYIRGLHDAGPVIATPKHFVGDGGTGWGTSTTGDYSIDQGVTLGDEAQLRALHLPPFERALAERAATVMVSYSSFGGMKMHEQRSLITDLLKTELDFDGFVVSDWGAIDQIENDYQVAVTAAINAGIDMNMVPSDYRRFIDTLTRAVEEGDVPMDRIDDAVRRILQVKLDHGLFESDPVAPLEVVGSEAHRSLGREAVRKSAVLLSDRDGLLPLSPVGGTILVGGQAADDIGIQSGGWTIEWQGAEGDITAGTTILDGIVDIVGSEEVVYDRFGRFHDAPPADVTTCVAVVGERPYAEGFGDAAEPRLPVEDIRVVSRMQEQCPRLAVVVVSGRPLLITDIIDQADATVAVWLPGSEGGGVADVLFGAHPFTGRLPYTWPASADQLGPDRVGEPLFPRGFGLTG